MNMKTDPNFIKLTETSAMVLGHVVNSAFMFNKQTSEEYSIFKFKREPTCGLIGRNNDWCLVGGNVLVLRTLADDCVRIFHDFKNIYQFKIVNDYSVQILINPWSQKASIWQLEINSIKLTSPVNELEAPVNIFKVKDFKDYINKPTTEQIVW
jgi:hypothetical protein